MKLVVVNSFKLSFLNDKKYHTFNYYATTLKYNIQ